MIIDIDETYKKISENYAARNGGTKFSEMMDVNDIEYKIEDMNSDYILVMLETLFHHHRNMSNTFAKGCCIRNVDKFIQIFESRVAKIDEYMTVIRGIFKYDDNYYYLPECYANSNHAKIKNLVSNIMYSIYRDSLAAAKEVDAELANQRN